MGSACCSFAFVCVVVSVLHFCIVNDERKPTEHLNKLEFLWIKITAKHFCYYWTSTSLLRSGSDCVLILLALAPETDANRNTFHRSCTTTFFLFFFCLHKKNAVVYLPCQEITLFLKAILCLILSVTITFAYNFPAIALWNTPPNLLVTSSTLKKKERKKSIMLWALRGKYWLWHWITNTWHLWRECTPVKTMPTPSFPENSIKFLSMHLQWRYDDTSAW